jgi:hypothetical protein
MSDTPHPEDPDDKGYVGSRPTNEEQAARFDEAYERLVARTDGAAPEVEPITDDQLAAVTVTIRPDGLMDVTLPDTPGVRTGLEIMGIELTETPDDAATEVEPVVETPVTEVPA